MDPLQEERIEDIFFSRLNSQLINREETFLFADSILSILITESDRLVIGASSGLISIYKLNSTLAGPSSLPLLNSFNPNLGSICSILRYGSEYFVVGERGKCLICDESFNPVQNFAEKILVRFAEYSDSSNFLVTAGEESGVAKAIIRDRNEYSQQVDPVDIYPDFQIEAMKVQGLTLLLAGAITLQRWDLALAKPEATADISGIKCIAATATQAFVVIHCKLYSLQLEHLNNKREIAIEDKIIKILISEDGHFLYATGRSVNIIHTSSGVIYGHVDLESMSPELLALDSTHLYVASSTTIKRYQHSDDYSMRVLQEFGSDVIDIQAAGDGMLIIADTPSSVVRFESIDGLVNLDREHKIKYSEETIICMAISESLSELAVANDLNTIKLYSLVNFTENDTLPYHNLPILKLVYCGNSLISFAFRKTKSEILIWSTNTIIDHTFEPALITSTDNYFIFISEELVTEEFGHPIVVKKTFVNFGNLEGQLVSKESHNNKKIHSLCSSNEYLAIVEGEIVVWELSSLGIYCKISCKGMSERDTTKHCTLIGNYLLIATHTAVHSFSIANKFFIGSFSLEYNLTKIIPSKDKIFLACGSKLLSIDNIFAGESNLYLMGPQVPTMAFKSYIRLLLKNHPVETLPAHVYSWVILPECLNIMHVLAYKANKTLLKDAFRSGCRFLRSESNLTPLTISLAKEFRDVTEYLIKKVSRVCLSNPYIMTVLEEDINAINDSEANSISDFYRVAMMAPVQENLSTYGKPKLDNLTLINPSLLVNQEDFLINGEKEESEYVTYLVSTFRLPFTEGSRSSIEYLISLAKCEDSDVFTTPFIRNYLNYKWDKVKLILQIHSFLYFTFLLVLVLNILVFENPILLGLLCIFNTIDLFYEILEIRFNSIAYLKSKTNLLDISRIILIYYYVICELYLDFLDNTNATIIIVVSFLRGILYFKMFKQTRYMIKMIEEIMKDSICFGIILIYMLLALAALFNFARETTDTYFNSFCKVYLMMYGQFDFDTNSNSEWICVYLISIALPLIMFNLLVAIMGDTYGRAYGEMTEMDFKAMTQMILEAEILISNFVAENPQKSYLQKCSIGSMVKEDLGGKLKNKMQACIKSINVLSNTFDSSIEKKQNELLISIKEVCNQKLEKLEELRKILIASKRSFLESLNN